MISQKLLILLSPESQFMKVFILPELRAVISLQHSILLSQLYLLHHGPMFVLHISLCCLLLSASFFIAYISFAMILELFFQQASCFNAPCALYARFLSLTKLWLALTKMAWAGNTTAVMFSLFHWELLNFSRISCMFCLIHLMYIFPFLYYVCYCCSYLEQFLQLQQFFCWLSVWNTAMTKF